MKNVILKNKNYITVFLILFFVFYWFSFRVEQIKKECFNVAVSEAQVHENDREDLKYYYWKCSVQNGL